MVLGRRGFAQVAGRASRAEGHRHRARPARLRRRKSRTSRFAPPSRFRRASTPRSSAAKRPPCGSTCTRANCGPASAPTGCRRFFRDLRDRVVTRAPARRASFPPNLVEPFRIEQQNVAAAGKSQRGDHRRPGAVLHHCALPFRRHVSGHGPDGRRKGARHDRNDSVQPGLAHASGARKILHGADGVAVHGRAVDDLDGADLLAAGKRLLAERAAVERLRFHGEHQPEGARWRSS